MEKNYSVERLSQFQNQTHSGKTYFPVYTKNVFEGLNEID